MIQALHLSNFRSLGEDVSITIPEVGPHLIVLAGLNGSGKSNVLDALRFLGDAFQNGLDTALRARGGVAQILRRGSDSIRIAVEAAHEDVRVVWVLELALDADGREAFSEAGAAVSGEQHEAWRETLREVREEALANGETCGNARIHQRVIQRKMEAGDAKHALPFEGPAYWKPEGPVGGTLLLGGGNHRKQGEVLRALRGAMQSIAVYTLYPPDLRAPQPSRNTSPMDGRGADWMSALLALGRLGMRDEFRAVMARLVPDLIDYRVNEVAGLLVPEFVHQNRSGATWGLNTMQESDGTIRCAAMLAAMMQEPLPFVLCLEEPELAIHVGALPVLVDQILVTSTLTTVFVTTHSPDLIDLVPSACVRVVVREDEGTEVRAVDGLQQEAVRRQLATMGTLLREEGLRAGTSGG